MATTAQQEKEFINKIAPFAVIEMKKRKILASVIIAQAILESGYGTSDLAIYAKNIHGLKCKLSGNTWETEWDGESKYTKKSPEQDKNGNESLEESDFRAYPDWETCIRDHSLYLIGAMNGNKPRFAGIVGEKDPRKVIEIAKAGVYATDTKYVEKVMDLIERFNLTQYDKLAEANEECDVKIIEKIASNNPCYTNGSKITPEGGMIHSVGTPQPDPLAFVKNWQSSSANTCVHAVVGKDAVAYQLLPWNIKAWHCGSGSKGSGNNTLISLEMTEPATIKYTSGANWIELGDGSNTKAHVLATYANAVQFFAFICKEYGFNPEDSNVIMSHHEGNVKGIASNHGDVEHIWDKFGLSMNQFRQDVKKAMEETVVSTVPAIPIDNSSDDTSTQEINPLDGTVTVIYQGFDGLNVRKAPSMLAEVDHVVKSGVFTVVGISADEKWYKLKSGLFITAIPTYVSFKATPEQKASTAGTGYYRVRKSWQDADNQIGAFKNKDNAVNLCKNNSGYKVYDDSGEEIYPLNESIPQNEEFKVKVTIPNLRIRKGPGTTYDYHKQGGIPVYTGKGEFTIVKVKEGPGASLWGLLKAYEKDEDGWISLDEVKIL